MILVLGKSLKSELVRIPSHCKVAVKLKYKLAEFSFNKNVWFQLNAGEVLLETEDGEQITLQQIEMDKAENIGFVSTDPNTG